MHEAKEEIIWRKTTENDNNNTNAHTKNNN